MNPAPLFVGLTHHTVHLLKQAGAEAALLETVRPDEVKGRAVVIAPSAAKPGADARAARMLRGMGAASVGVVTTDLLKSSGALDLAGHLETTRDNGQQPKLDTVAAGALEEARKSSLADRQHSRTLRFTPIGELLSQPEEPTQYLVDGLLPVGGLSVLAARPKVGKSTLSRSLIASVARGKQFIGRATLQGAVFLLDLEGKKGETVKALRELGVTEADNIKVFCGTAPNGAIDELRVAALQERPALIVIDPLQRLARVPDLNDYARVSNALDNYIALARDTGAHVMLLHHQGRGERGGVDSPMGSTAIAGSVDTIMTMRRRDDGTRTLSTVQRYGTDLEETVVTLDAQGHAGAGGLVKDHEQQEAAGRILAYLKDNPGAEQGDIKEGVEGRWSVVRAALTGLFKGVQLTRSGTGRKGDAYRYSVAGNAGFSGSAGSKEPREPENQNPSGEHEGEL